MPITQDRMMALIRAADSSAAKLAALRAVCAAAVARGDSEAALATIAEAITSQFYTLTQGEIETIVAERIHFKHCEHRNRRSSARLRRKRASTAIQGDTRGEQTQTDHLDSFESLAALADEALDGDLDL